MKYVLNTSVEKILMQTRLCELFSVVFVIKPFQNILILFDYGFPFAIPADNLYFFAEY